MNIPKTNDPTEEQIEEAHRLVMEKDPETLYRVVGALNQGHDPEMQRYSAFYIYHLYLAEDKPVPENITEIINDLEAIYLQFQTPFDEALDVVEQADHKAYISDNKLEWVIDLLRDKTDNLDEKLHYEFVYLVHINNLNNFPNDPDILLSLYLAWLSSGV